jgi:Uncharacterized protein conserved in bacteria
MANDEVKIYFDADGVLADFDEYCRSHNIPLAGNDCKDDALVESMWSEIRDKHPHFYYNLKPMKGSVELFKQLNSKYHCEVLTAVPRPSRGITNAAQDKIDWCKKYLGDDVVINICRRKDKQNFVKDRTSILIDDYEKNIKEWERNGGTGILFTGADNVDLSLIDRIASRQGFMMGSNINKLDIEFN